MKYEVEELGATKRKFTVEIPAEDISRALDAAYVELNRSVKEDGFRPGKTPRALLEKKYGKTVENDVLQKVVPDNYSSALEQSGTVPVASPKIQETLAIKKGEPLTFTAVVEVMPKFDLADYKGIEITERAVEVSDQEVDDELQEIRASHSVLDTISEDREARKDDYAVIDFEGSIDSEPIEGGKAENYPLMIGSQTFIPGFEEQVVGMRKGEYREITVSFPEDYKTKELAGKPALFKVTLKELKEKKLPEADDEFAKDTGIGNTLAELKDKLKDEIMEHKRRGEAMRQKEEIMKALEERHSFELPESLVEGEVRSILVRKYQEMMRSGKGPGESGFDHKAFQEQARPVAELRVKDEIILSAIAEKENIGVTDAELESMIRGLAVQTGSTPDQVREYYEKRGGGLDSLKSSIGEEKVLDFLRSYAKKVAA